MCLVQTSNSKVQSIESFGAELGQLRDQALGVLLVGDVNVHSKRWQYHSSYNSKDVEQMRDLCLKAGPRQIVRGPPRGEHLLDLVVTDIESASASVLSKITNHSIVTVKLNLTLPRSASHSRKVWSYAKADRDGL